MARVFFPCSHRWSVITKIIRDRYHWTTAQKCRKCGRKEQTFYVMNPDSLRISCETNEIHEYKNKTNEPVELDNSDTV